jgi:cytochrome c
MFMRKHLSMLAAGLLAGLASAQDAPELGEPVDAEMLAEIDYTVLPDGDGLPEGTGTAIEGANVFRQHCIACHGDGGTGGVNDTLVGGHGSLTSNRPQKTVGSYWPYATTVFDYVRRAMPLQAPGTLANDEVYAVTAYLLHLNGIIAEDTPMTAKTLPAVKMPNRDGFSWAYSP